MSWRFRVQKVENKKDLFNSIDENKYLSFENFTIHSRSSTLRPPLLDNINLRCRPHSICGIIGPSGAGKSLLLGSIFRSLSSYNEEDENCILSGKIYFRGTELFTTNFHPQMLKDKIGWISQKPILFPLSIRENILYAVKSRGLFNEKLLSYKLEKVLKECALWDELHDRLDCPAESTLSGGQAQRLCIARALILEPEIFLMDEPTSALDPKSSSKIEELLLSISKKITILIVSHSLSQIKHIADYTVFMKNGKIIEQGETQVIFTSPKTRELKDFISGKY